MDYQQLKIILPKFPQKWSPCDVQTWLRFIGLESLIPSFKLHSIDGSCILSLEQADLKDQLQVGSGIVIKKLMACKNKSYVGIRIGLKEYEEFLFKQTTFVEGGYKSIKSHVEIFKQKEKEKERERKENEIDRFQEREQQAATENIEYFDNDQSSTFGTLQLILQQITTGQPNHKISVPRFKENFKIGRNSSNDLIIAQSEVSRNHAEINYNDGSFYIKDLNSTTGTFVKVRQPVEVKVGSMIEVGSHLMEIESVTPHKIILSMTSEEGPKLVFEKQWAFKGEIGIGRKSTNAIIIQDDSHMSNNHAVLYSQDGRYYFKDLGTTNGSWLKLSMDPVLYNIHEIKEETVFKIGPTITYMCKLKYVFPEPSNGMDQKLNCAICFVNTRDCVIQPCNHSNTCMKCCKNLKECPICRIKIEQTLKIYHM